MGIKSEQLNKVQQILGVEFKDKKILEHALTHPSVELPYSYERLEFLGDSVLGLIVAEMLFKEFSNDDEGDLSKKHVNLVRRHTLAKISKEIGLGYHIIMSDSEEKTGGRLKLSNLENVLEACIAAIFLDSGIESAKKFVHKHWYKIARTVKEAPSNPKNTLQELAQSKGMELPVYKTIKKIGQDHSPVFKVEAQIKGKTATGSATSKKMAEQEAAKNLLEKIQQ